MEQTNKLFTTGVAGAFLVVLCCATPILVILLGAIGLGAVTGYLDYILMPALVIFLGIALFAYLKQQKSDSQKSCCDQKEDK